MNDNCLYYFEFTTDKEPRGIIPLENIRVREVSDRSKQHCFELFSANNEVIKACKTDSEGKVVEGKEFTTIFTPHTRDYGNLLSHLLTKIRESNAFTKEITVTESQCGND